jgi:hypothetical protein
MGDDTRWVMFMCWRELCRDYRSVNILAKEHHRYFCLGGPLVVSRNITEEIFQLELNMKVRLPM